MTDNMKITGTAVIASLITVAFLVWIYGTVVAVKSILDPTLIGR